MAQVPQRTLLSASLLPWTTPFVDAQGRIARDWWPFVQAVFNRTGGTGTPVDMATLQNFPFIVAAAVAQLTGAFVLQAKAPLNLLAQSGKAILSLDTPLAVTAGGTGAGTAGGARANLGLGSMSTQDAGSVAITGGNASGLMLQGVEMQAPSQTAGPAAGAADVLPVKPAGYVSVTINGKPQLMAYY